MKNYIFYGIAILTIGLAIFGSIRAVKYMAESPLPEKPLYTVNSQFHIEQADGSYIFILYNFYKDGAIKWSFSNSVKLENINKK